MSDLAQLKRELEEELHRILRYWMLHTVDRQEGGFYGSIDQYNKADRDAPKGLVMHARVLWAFSVGYEYTNDKNYLAIAERAATYITDHFLDPEHGGYYWSVMPGGKKLDDRKQVYGQAFCLYAWAAFYKATGRDSALLQAKQCYEWIEEHSHDRPRGGYIEAFNRDWSATANLRLSEKDLNEKKTMNTHLHALEAYTSLYHAWKDESLRECIMELLNIFKDHIIDPSTGHLRMFFDEEWNAKDATFSFGHDIEAAWLLWEAAEACGDMARLNEYRFCSLQLVKAAEEGLDKDGGLWYEELNGVLVKEKHWWPQAEAMVGFFHAWQLTGEERYLMMVNGSWAFIKNYLMDLDKGEWHWGVREDHSVMTGHEKAGFWKCPYHNTRACLELSNRIQKKLSGKCLETVHI